MSDIDEDVEIVFRAQNLKLNTSVTQSTITIENIVLSDDQAAVIGYLINNPRNLLSAEIKLTGRITA